MPPNQGFPCVPGCSYKQLGASTMPEHSARRSFGNRLFCLHTRDVEVANHEHGPPSIKAQVDPKVQHLPNEQQQSLLYPLQALLWLLTCKFSGGNKSASFISAATVCSLATSSALTVEGRLSPAALAAPKATPGGNFPAFMACAAAGATPGACAACTDRCRSPAWSGRGRQVDKG